MASIADRLTLRAADGGDIPAILALNQRFYAGEAWVNESFFAWRFGATPGGSPIMFLALDGDKLAGSFSVFPLRFQLDGQPVLAGAAWAVLMNPDYSTVILRRDGRLKSIFIALADLAFDECRRRGMAFIYCFPNAASSDGFVKHLGFARLDTLKFRLCPLRFAPLLRQKFAWLGPAATLAAGPARLAFRVLAARRRPAREVLIAPAAFDDPRLMQVWERCRGGWPLLAVRDSAYYSWRFARNPYATYKLLIAQAGRWERPGVLEPAEPLGMLVYTRQKFQDRQRGGAVEAGAIADWLVTNDADGPRVLHSLLVRAAAALKDDGAAAVIACDNLDSPWQESFRRAGFHTFPGEKAPKQFPLTVRVLGEPASRDVLVDPARWLLNFADNDVV